MFYDEYYFDGVENKSKWQKLLDILEVYSDAFSLFYFRYSENEHAKETVKKIDKALKPYLIKSRTYC